MIELYRKIEADMKHALKEGDAIKLSCLRMALSAIKTLEIEKKDMEEADVLQIIQRQIKQHKESIEQFEKGERPDLADKEAKELAILEAYVPKQLNEDELLTIIKGVISETGAAAKSDAGRVMKAVMDKVRGRADGKVVNRVVMSLLR